MSTLQLAEQLQQLPSDARLLVEDFIEFLRKRESRPIEPPTFSWEGGLEEIKDEFTSIELQKKALEWM